MAYFAKPISFSPAFQRYEDDKPVIYIWVHYYGSEKKEFSLDKKEGNKTVKGNIAVYELVKFRVSFNKYKLLKRKIDTLKSPVKGKGRSIVRILLAEQRYFTFPVKNGPPEHIHILKITNLPCNTHFAIELIGMKKASKAEVRTFPEKASKSPFVLYASSCYHQPNDKGIIAKFANSISELPHLKINCGDQVYMDLPLNSFKPTQFRDKYESNWSISNLGAYLRRGTNVFLPDNHEYWVSCPNILFNPAFGLRNPKLQIALLKHLYSVYQQSCNPVEKESEQIKIESYHLDLGLVSLFCLDTRSNRKYIYLDKKTGEKLEDVEMDIDYETSAEMNAKAKRYSLYKPDCNFISEEDFTKLSDWIANLDKPGVLVTGQPLFLKGDEHPFWTDLNPMDFDHTDSQYEKILQLLIKESKYDILIICGDPHYGRGIRFEASKERFIYEIISSPISLIEKDAGHITKLQNPDGIWGLHKLKLLIEASRPKLKDVLNDINNHFVLPKKFVREGRSKVDILYGTVVQHHIAKITISKLEEDSTNFTEGVNIIVEWIDLEKSNKNRSIILARNALQAQRKKVLKTGKLEKKRMAFLQNKDRISITLAKRKYPFN